MARKLGVGRNQVVRLENRPSRDLTFNEMTALSEVVGIEIHDMVQKLSRHPNRHSIDRGKIGKPVFVYEREGIRYESLIEHTGKYFVGTLTLRPRQIISESQTPRAPFLFYLILEGQLLVTSAGKEMIFKSSDCFHMNGLLPYEFYNPHQIQNLTAVIFSITSFIPSIA